MNCGLDPTVMDEDCAGKMADQHWAMLIYRSPATVSDRQTQCFARGGDYLLFAE